MGFNPFAGLKDAKIFEKGQYFPPGVYDVEVAKCTWFKTRGKGDAYIAEFVVLNSNNPDVKLGEKRSWYQGMADISIGFGALKEFIYAIVGIKDWTREKERVSELDQQVPDPTNPKEKISQIELLALQSVEQGAFDKTKLHLEVFTKVTKVNKRDFSVHKWSPYQEAA